jgi:hypothetical protein
MVFWKGGLTARRLTMKIADGAKPCSAHRIVGQRRTHLPSGKGSDDGTNGHYPNMCKLDYSFEMARQLDLKPANMFTPAPDGLRAVQRRKG